MRCESTNSALRIFYAADNLITGLSVTFNIWNDSGVPLNSNQPALSEVGSEGIYYLDITTPSTDQHLLIIGSNSGVAPKAEIVKIGSPNSKAFYVHGSFTENITIGFDIYDSSNSIVSTGVLDEIVSGFYSTDTQGFSEPWFFEVFPLTSKNTPCS
jgi:hypothetical protein